jgi:predicted nucleotidyltransferase component of viral defense system
MIPAAHIADWRRRAPWSTDAQVEQDLVLCRALVELFSSERLKGLLAFRGGTALHKLVFDPPGRYSEDIDLVQVTDGTRKAIMDALPRLLQPWLGKSKYKQSEDRLTYLFRFESEIEPVVPLRLKVEINMTENFTVLGHETQPFKVDSPWYSGSADVITYAHEELLGTKLRALYQRSKGRDLFDLYQALNRLPNLDLGKMVDCFQAYLRHGGFTVSRAEFEEHMQDRMGDKKFTQDVAPLLVGADSFDAVAAYEQVHDQLIIRLPGEPWKGLTEG